MSKLGIESVLARCLGEGVFPGVVSAYLFGSEAAGRAHLESDVDIGVILRPEAHRTERDRFEQRLRLVSRLEAALAGRAADVVVLNDAPPGLARHVVIAGRRVYCADSPADHAFVRDAQLRAADLEPFLRRMRGIKLQAIARP